MGVWAWDAPDRAETVSVRWEEGVPVELNGTPLDTIAMFTQANRIAGIHGVGIGTHVVENRFVGVKSRGIYEAPGMELLGRSYEYLLQLVLDRRARELFDLLSGIISVQIIPGLLARPRNERGAGRPGADHEARVRDGRRPSLQGECLLRGCRRV